MADTVQYVITIRNETGEGGRSKPGGVSKTSSGDDVSGFYKKTIKSFLGIAGVATAKKAVDFIATTNINRVSIRTGESVLQEKLNYAYSWASRIGGIGLSLAGGFAAGGPAGLAVAAVGSAASLIGTAIDLNVARENIALERTVESIGIAQANIRAGAGGDRNGRTPY